jgi:hypothetical protein
MTKGNEDDMAKQDQFPEVYTQLKALLTPYADRMQVITDEAGHYYLNAPKSHPQRPREPLFFGAARIGKQYVSYYLMPVYVEPALLEGVSPELRKRMQGKSCFNFTRVDNALLAELEGLTARGFAMYVEQGWV